MSDAFYIRNMVLTAIEVTLKFASIYLR